MNEHEEAFARRFVAPDRRSRYVTLLSSKRGRQKVVANLPHFGDLDFRFAIEVTNETRSEIRKLLLEKGAPKTCYVMSGDTEWDGMEISFEDALNEVAFHSEGTLMSFIPGKLAYFELEGLESASS
ncbi:MAG: hypothetical protein ABL949_06435 [Fimbriimonadaceae bacterium]